MNTNEEMLQFLYKSASMSADVTARMLKKTHDPKLVRELSSQIGEYKSFADNAESLLKVHGLAPADNSTVTKLMTNMGIEVNTAIDSSPSHIAEIMINGINMGIIKMNKHLNRNSACKEETRKKCTEMIEYQKKSIDRLESYLS